MGMTELATLVEPLKRELAIPGAFEEVFPNTTEADLEASLADGFGEAQLWGFFPDMTVEEQGGSFVTSADLSVAGCTLVIIFSAMRIIRAQLRSTLTTERYSAKPGTEVEFQRSAMLLREEFKFLENQRKELIEQARQRARAAAGTSAVFDNYVARTSIQLVNSGFFAYEVK